MFPPGKISCPRYAVLRSFFIDERRLRNFQNLDKESRIGIDPTLITAGLLFSVRGLKPL